MVETIGSGKIELTVDTHKNKTHNSASNALKNTTLKIRPTVSFLWAGSLMSVFRALEAELVLFLCVING